MMFDQLDDYELEQVSGPARKVAIAPPLAGQADTERGARLDAERVTTEWRNKSTRRLDGGRRSIEDSPLFGGERQDTLF